MTVRALNPTNPADFENLKKILDSYLETEKNKVHPVYIYEDIVTFVDWMKSSFLEKDMADFVISARFSDLEIDQVYVAYKLEAAWNRPMSTVVPYWVVGLMYFKNKEWKSPSDQILNLEKLVLDHFEKQKYTTGHIVIKAPSGMLNLSDSSTINKYINTVLRKTLPAYRYDFSIENIFKNQEDLDNYKFSAFKAMLPKRILKPVVLLSFKLKYENRINW
jgi:hypothetical protein